MIIFIGVWRSSNNISDTKWLMGETECRSWLCFKLFFFPLVFHWLSLYRLCVTDVVVDILSQLVSVSLMRYRYCYWFHHSTSLGIGYGLLFRCGCCFTTLLCIFYALNIHVLLLRLFHPSQLVTASVMRLRNDCWFTDSVGNCFVTDIVIDCLFLSIT